MATRRSFLQWAAASAAASLAAGQVGFAEDPISAAAKRKSGGRTAAPFELGMAGYTLRNFPLEQQLALTLQLGLKHICLKTMFKPEEIAEAKAKLKPAEIDVYGTGVVYMATPEQVQSTFAYAKAAGMRTIVGCPTPEMLPLVQETIQKHDIRLAIHNHGPGDKRYPMPVDAYEAIKDLDRRIGLCIDIGHTARGGQDPSDAVEQFADRLYDVHIKDVFAATPEGDTVEIGRGVIDIPRFLHTLVKIRYANIVSFEFDVTRDDPLPGVAESIGYVRGVLAAG